MKILNKAFIFIKNDLSCLSADGTGAFIVLQCGYDPAVYGST